MAEYVRKIIQDGGTKYREIFERTLTYETCLTYVIHVRNDMIKLLLKR